jgi:hypothetical protein
VVGPQPAITRAVESGSDGSGGGEGEGGGGEGDGSDSGAMTRFSQRMRAVGLPFGFAAMAIVTTSLVEEGAVHVTSSVSPSAALAPQFTKLSFHCEVLSVPPLTMMAWREAGPRIVYVAPGEYVVGTD